MLGSELFMKNRKSSHCTQMSAKAWHGGVPVTVSFWFHTSACPFTPISIHVLAS